MAYHSDNTVYRDTENAMVGGVCAGLSDYFRVDVTLIRIAASILVFALGSGLLIYIVLWALLPAKKNY